MDPLGIAKRVQNYGRHDRTPPKASGLKRFIGCIWTKTGGLGPRYWTCRDRSFWGIKGLSQAEFVGVGIRVFVRFGIRKLGYRYRVSGGRFRAQSLGELRLCKAVVCCFPASLDSPVRPSQQMQLAICSQGSRALMEPLQNCDRAPGEPVWNARRLEDTFYNHITLMEAIQIPKGS